MKMNNRPKFIRCGFWLICLDPKVNKIIFRIQMVILAIGILICVRIML